MKLLRALIIVVCLAYIAVVILLGFIGGVSYTLTGVAYNPLGFTEHRAAVAFATIILAAIISAVCSDWSSYGK